MARAEAFLANLCIGMLSMLVVAVLLEAGARYYLWHLASEQNFHVLASINQIKQRYGDDFFLINDKDSPGKMRRLSPHHFLGFYPTPNPNRNGNKHNTLG